MKEMKTYAIVCKQDDVSYEISQKIRCGLDEKMSYDEENPELVISVGGDGTMIYSVHKYMEQLDKVSFIGIHTGTLGFLTDYQKEECDELIEDILKDEYKIYNRCILEARIDQKVYRALNEIRVENNRRSQVLGVFINGSFFETFRGSGLCVSTASGSTAYNKSIGGAVINSGAGLMQMSEIAGIHHNAYRSLGSSLILDWTHVIHLESDNFENAILGVDNLVFDLKDVHCIDISLAKQPARFVQYKRVPFITRLKRSFLSE